LKHENEIPVEATPAESVLRCAHLKQHRQLSYEELAFHLENSASFRAFARLPMSWTPKKSVLHKDDQRHQSRDLGGDQPRPAGQRAPRENRGHSRALCAPEADLTLSFRRAAQPS
jgi:IS5 family transposase